MRLALCRSASRSLIIGLLTLAACQSNEPPRLLSTTDDRIEVEWNKWTATRETVDKFAEQTCAENGRKAVFMAAEAPYSPYGPVSNMVYGCFEK